MRIISQIVNLKDKKIIIITILMFYYKISWFYQDFKGENLWFLNLHSLHAVRILDLSMVAESYHL